MADRGVLVNEFADEFPKVQRPGAGAPRQRTDLDVALEQLKKEWEQTVATVGQPSRALKAINYNVETAEDGTVSEVDETQARTRAQARVQSLRKRGYTKEAGWRLSAIGGHLWAQYYGEGGHPKPKTQNEESAEGQATVAA